MGGDRLVRLEAYYDAVPRADAEVVDTAGFSIFHGPPDGPRYARPRLDAADAVTLNEVYEAVSRQRALGLEPAFEWVAEVTPGLAELVRRAGLPIEYCPLLVLNGAPVGAAGVARMLRPDELEDFTLARAAVGVAFTAGGWATGLEGVEARDAVAATAGSGRQAAFVARRFRMAAVYDLGGAIGPVGGGGHTPVGETSEITGVAVLPAYRHRGLAAALTYVLAEDAIEHDVTTVFCSPRTRRWPGSTPGSASSGSARPVSPKPKFSRHTGVSEAQQAGARRDPANSAGVRFRGGGGRAGRSRGRPAAPGWRRCRRPTARCRPARCA